MNMKMQNLKPNLKEEKGTIWTFFFFNLLCFDGFAYLPYIWRLECKRKQKTKAEKMTISNCHQGITIELFYYLYSFSN